MVCRSRIAEVETMLFELVHLLHPSMEDPAAREPPQPSHRWEDALAHQGHSSVLHGCPPMSVAAVVPWLAPWSFEEQWLARPMLQASVVQLQIHLMACFHLVYLLHVALDLSAGQAAH